MSDFDDKRDAAETKFAFQERQSFEVEAKTCKKFGLWAAEKLGLEGADAETYARTVIEANLEEPGFEDVFRHVRKDLDKKGLVYQDDDLSQRLDECLQKAKLELSKD